MSTEKRRDPKLKSHEETFDHVLDTYLPEVDHDYNSSDEFVKFSAKREAVEYITGIEFNPQDEKVENYVEQLEGWMKQMFEDGGEIMPESSKSKEISAEEFWEPESPEVADGEDDYIEAEYFFDPRMDPGNMVDELEERPGPAT